MGIQKMYLAVFAHDGNGLFLKSVTVSEAEDVGEETLRLSSDAFGNNEMIPRKYTCDGENMNPPLRIENVPVETQSLALIVHDPDAKTGGGWTHWVVFNIDPSVSYIAENSVPQGSVEGTTSFGKTGYGGPCPPHSKKTDLQTKDDYLKDAHHYEFSIYAFDSRLLLDEDAQKHDVERAMEGHIIDQYTLVGLYVRAN